MGKALQVRGTIQAVDLRTLNAEINEIVKKDISEIDFRSVKEFDVSTGVVDKEVSFTDAGISIAKFVYLTSDNPIVVKVNQNLFDGFPTKFFMHLGEIEKLYISAGAMSAHVRIIAFA